MWAKLGLFVSEPFFVSSIKLLSFPHTPTPTPCAPVVLLSLYGHAKFNFFPLPPLSLSPSLSVIQFKLQNQSPFHAFPQLSWTTNASVFDEWNRAASFSYQELGFKFKIAVGKHGNSGLLSYFILSQRRRSLHLALRYTCSNYHIIQHSCVTYI